MSVSPEIEAKRAAAIGVPYNRHVVDATVKLAQDVIAALQKAEQVMLADVPAIDTATATELSCHIQAVKLARSKGGLDKPQITVMAYTTIRGIVLEQAGPRPADMAAASDQERGIWKFLDATGMLPWFRPQVIYCPACEVGQPYRVEASEVYRCSESDGGCTWEGTPQAAEEELGFPVRTYLGFLVRAHAFDGVAIDG